uniref:Uncharacterized protein n=1 Tax=Arundo donax TaxID=35708 RepID=A0A0A9B501_ARUDO
MTRPQLYRAIRKQPTSSTRCRTI